MAGTRPSRRARRVRAAEAALTALAGRQLDHFLPCDVRDRGDDELRDAVAATDADGCGPEVDEQHADLATVVGIDRARRVEQGQPFPVRQATPWSHLPLVSDGNGEREPGRYEPSLARAEYHVGRDVRGEIHAGRAGRHIAR